VILDVTEKALELLVRAVFLEAGDEASEDSGQRPRRTLELDDLAGDSS
jgi:hypothetical protein